MMNSKIKQFIIFGICSVFALALCLVVLVVTVNNLENEQNTSQNKEIESLTQLDDSNKTLIAYINTLVANTDNRFVKTKTYTNVSVNELSVSEKSENKAGDDALLNFIKDKILPTVDTYYKDDSEGTFKDDDSNKLSLVLNEGILNNASYSVGLINEKGESVLDDEGNLVDNEFHYLNFEIDGAAVSANEKLSKMFSLEDDVKAKTDFINAIKDNCKINSFEEVPESILINAKVNRVTDKIEYINIIRNYNVTVNAEFINKAEFFGEKAFSFIYSVTDTYEYSYAGITFTEDEITVASDEEYMLGVSAIIDDDSEYTVEFVSSDEDIAVVDEMGYVKALKNCNVPVIITVKLIYFGETFTDTCVVNVSEE